MTSFLRLESTLFGKRDVLCFLWWDCVGRNSSVGIETAYRLDGPGIEFRCGRDFKGKLFFGGTAICGKMTFWR